MKRNGEGGRGGVEERGEEKGKRRTGGGRGK